MIHIHYSISGQSNKFPQSFEFMLISTESLFLTRRKVGDSGTRIIMARKGKGRRAATVASCIRSYGWYSASPETSRATPHRWNRWERQDFPEWWGEGQASLGPQVEGILQDRLARRGTWRQCRGLQGLCRSRWQARWWPARPGSPRSRMARQSRWLSPGEDQKAGLWLETFLPMRWRPSPPARPPTRAARGIREPIQEASESDTASLRQRARVMYQQKILWKQTRKSSLSKSGRQFYHTDHIDKP